MMWSTFQMPCIETRITELANCARFAAEKAPFGSMHAQNEVLRTQNPGFGAGDPGRPENQKPNPRELQLFSPHFCRQLPVFANFKGHGLTVSNYIAFAFCVNFRTLLLEQQTSKGFVLLRSFILIFLISSLLLFNFWLSSCFVLLRMYGPDRSFFIAAWDCQTIDLSPQVDKLECDCKICCLWCDMFWFCSYQTTGS